MSLIPVATAWARRFLNQQAPEYFYLSVFFLWSIAYWWLTRALIQAHTDSEIAKKIAAMPPFLFMNSWRLPTFTVGLAIVIYFFPPACLLATGAELIYMALHTTPDADRVN